jgi:stress response protein SCP2
MKELVRGEKVKLSDYTSHLKLQIEVNVQSPCEIDITCFGLDGEKKLSDDQYMIFYNQMQSPNKEIQLLSYGSGNGTYSIDLAKLSSPIQNLVFAATIDGNGTMSMIQNGSIVVSAEGKTILRYQFKPSDFQNEKAIIISEVYCKSLWRVASVGKGFDGGLAALLKHFGGEVAEEQSVHSPSSPVMPKQVQKQEIPTYQSVNQKKILLEKKMEKKAPKLLDLSKKAKISLEKVGLQNHEAKVALCLDISGSMSSLYRSGKIQKFAERILALGTRFDDDGSIDIFLFGQRAHNAGELTIDNFNGFVNNLTRKYPLEGGTYYGKVMKEIRQYYFGSSINRQKPLVQDVPVYVMFVTDGATADESVTLGQIQSSSYEPIFWQFMAIGRSSKDIKKRGFFASIFQSDFSFLEKLDNLTGRFIDNANFFSVEDPQAIADNELYDLLMGEYPSWVQQASSKGLINKAISRLV